MTNAAPQWSDVGRHAATLILIRTPIPIADQDVAPQEVRQKVEYADVLGRQLQAAKAERAAAEETGRRQHAVLLAKEEALSAALQKQLARPCRRFPLWVMIEAGLFLSASDTEQGIRSHSCLILLTWRCQIRHCA